MMASGRHGKRPAARSAFYWLALVVALIGMSISAWAERTPEIAAPPPYQVVTNMHQTMDWIVYPAADVIWDSAGTVITAEGSEELAPTSDEGWAEVERAAATLSESGNLLMMPGRALGDDWIAYSQALVETGKLALQAAQAQDSDALFDAGGRIFQVCKACHTQYWVEDDGEAY